MYRDSYGLLRVAVITCTVGVRQGSPTSCFLFTLYVNPYSSTVLINVRDDLK